MNRHSGRNAWLTTDGLVNIALVSTQGQLLPPVLANGHAHDMAHSRAVGNGAAGGPAPASFGELAAGAEGGGRAVHLFILGCHSHGLQLMLD